MQFLNFTPQETKALIFLLLALLVGSGITLYKRTQPQFAPELIVEKREVDSLLQIQSPLNQEQGKKKINLNQATSAELQLLPGVGPTLSRRIVEYREANGKFHQIEELKQIPGIGLKKFEQLKEYITVE
ncbi:MAG: helix-hairpin-helix domain-containing protein [candidate division Zixibacteria bacterium]|nr:helix-hairpin-helix domain-containing protein [candidate division Zixibacteria bacterium]